MFQRKSIFFDLAFGVLIVAVIFQAARAGQIEALTTNPVSAFSSTRGITTFYALQFKTQTEITSSALIRVKFPEEFARDLTGGSGDILECFLRPRSGQETSYSCSITTLWTISVNVGSLLAGEYKLTINKVLNPSSVESSGRFGVVTAFADAVVDQNQDFGAVSFSGSPELLRNPSVKGQSQVISEVSSFTFKFDVPTSVPSGNTVRFWFPPGFTSKQPFCSVNGLVGSTPIATLTYDNSRVICSKIFKSLGTGEEITVTGVANPPFSGTLQGFVIEVLGESSSAVLYRAQFGGNVLVKPGSLKVEYIPKFKFKQANTTYLYYINLFNELNPDTVLFINYTSAWNLWKPNCSIIQGVTPFPDRPAICRNIPGENSYMVENYQRMTPAERITLSVDLISPDNELNYLISVSSYNRKYNGIVDIITINHEVNSTFGRTDVLNSYPLVRATKLRAGQSGPIELTYILRNNLQKTTEKAASGNGRFLIEIYPQLPAAVPTSEGVLNCYFFYRITAERCTWDNTNAAKTVITMTTPDNMDFRYSELPITITTEGATGSKTEGILIDTLIKRYNFHIHFLKLAAETPISGTQDEVDFFDWYPDAEEILDSKITANSLVLERGETTLLKIVHTVQHALSINADSLVRRYFFRVKFPRSGGWAGDLGHSIFQLKIIDYPCIVTDDDSTSVPTPTSVKCRMYVGDANTDSTIDIGDWGTIPINAKPYIEIPNLLISASAAVTSKLKIRFEILESTPSDSFQELLLYYKDIELGTILTQTSTTWATNTPAVTTTLGSAVPGNTASTYQFALTSGSSIQDALFEIPYSPFNKLAIEKISCGSSKKCVTLEPVSSTNYRQWIHLNQPASTTVDAQLASGKINNPAHVGTLGGRSPDPTTTNYKFEEFYVRTVDNTGSIINKIQYSVIIDFQQFTSASITATATPQATVNQLSNHIFTFQFTNTVIIPVGGAISLMFDDGGSDTSAKAQTAGEFYCKITGLTGANVNIGVVCTKTAGNEISITDFAQVAVNTALTVEIYVRTPASATFVVKVRAWFDRQKTKLIQYSTLTGNSAGTNQGFDKFETVYPVVHPYATQIAPFIFNLSPNTAAATKIRLTFPSGFSIAGTDQIPLCTVNDAKRYCSMTSSSPLIITISNSATLSNAGVYKISISSDITDNDSGLVFPTNPGDYLLSIELLDDGGSVLNKMGMYYFVRPEPLRTLTVASAHRTPNLFSMYSWDLVITKNLIQSAVLTSDYSVIQLMFPTQTGGNQGGFALNLGAENLSGGTAVSGDPISCAFDGLLGSPKCTLIASTEAGRPATIEITGYSAITASSGSPVIVKIRIAKIKNPSLTDYKLATFTAYIFQRAVSDGAITPLYFSEYFYFQDLQSNSKSGTVNTATSDTQFQASSKVGDTSKTLTLNIYSTSYPFGIGDYFVINYGSATGYTMGINDLVNNKLSSCPTTITDECWIFKDIGWIVLRISAAISATTSITTAADLKTWTAVPISGNIEIISMVWKSGQYTEDVKHIFQQTYLVTMIRTLTGPAAAAIGPAGYVLKRSDSGDFDEHLSFTFTTVSEIPVGGSIRITFPSGFTNLKPNCRSNIRDGSLIKSVISDYVGDVNCEVEASALSWLINGFKSVAASSKVEIYGIATTPDANGATTAFKFETCEDNLCTKVRDNVNTATLTIQTDISGMKDLEFKTNIRDYLQTNYVGPFSFFFNKAASCSAGLILELKLGRNNLIGSEAKGFDLIECASHACYLKKLSNGVNYACQISSVSTETNFIVYTLTLVDGCDIGTDYEITVTNYFNTDQNDGIIYPTGVGIYQALLNVKSDTSTLVHSTSQYLEVFPPKFTYAEFVSHKHTQNINNLLEVHLQPNVQMATSDILTIKIHLTNVENNLGISSSNVINPSESTKKFGRFDVELFGGDITDISCDFLKNVKTAELHCSGFGLSGTPTAVATDKYLRLAFWITNPNIAPYVHLPVEIYTTSSTTRLKTNYNFIEKGVAISSASTPSTLSGAALTLGSTSVRPLSTPSTTLTLTMMNSVAMMKGDSYVLQFLFDFSDVQNSPADCATPCKAYFLPKNKLVIIRPYAEKAISFNPTVQTWRNPHYVLPTSQKPVSGWISYSSRVDWAPVTHTNYPDLTGLSEAPTAFTLSRDHSLARARSDYLVSITMRYKFVNTIILKPPPQFLTDFTGECFQAFDSEIEVESCQKSSEVNGLTTTYIKIVIIPATVETDKKLSIRTNNQAFLNPSSTAALGTWDIYRFVSSNGKTDQSPKDFLNHYISATTPSGNAVFTDDEPAASEPTYLEVLNERYHEDRPQDATGQYSPIRLLFKEPTGVPLAVGSKIRVEWDTASDLTAPTGTDIGDYGTNAQLECLIEGVKVNCDLSNSRQITLTLKNQMVASSTNIIKIGFGPERLKDGFSLAADKTIRWLVSLLDSSNVILKYTRTDWLHTRTNYLTEFKLTNKLTTKINEYNAFEFKFKTTQPFDTIVIQFMTIDENGNDGFDSDLGMWLNGGPVGCEIGSNFETTCFNGEYQGLSCHFTKGSSTNLGKQAYVTIRGITISNPANPAYLYILGKNPNAVNRRASFKAWLFSGTAIKAYGSHLSAFITESGSLGDTSLGTYDAVQQTTLALGRADMAINFKVQNAILSGGLILLKFKSSNTCTVKSSSTSFYIPVMVANTLERFLIVKADANKAVSDTLTAYNFRCYRLALAEWDEYNYGNNQGTGNKIASKLTFGTTPNTMNERATASMALSVYTATAIKATIPGWMGVSSFRNGENVYGTLNLGALTMTGIDINFGNIIRISFQQANSMFSSITNCHVTSGVGHAKNSPYRDNPVTCTINTVVGGWKAIDISQFTSLSGELIVYIQGTLGASSVFSTNTPTTVTTNIKFLYYYDSNALTENEVLGYYPAGNTYIQLNNFVEETLAATGSMLTVVPDTSVLERTRLRFSLTFNNEAVTGQDPCYAFDLGKVLKIELTTSGEWMGVLACKFFIKSSNLGTNSNLFQYYDGTTDGWETTSCSIGLAGIRYTGLFPAAPGKYIKQNEVLSVEFSPQDSRPEFTFPRFQWMSMKLTENSDGTKKFFLDNKIFEMSTLDSDLYTSTGGEKIVSDIIAMSATTLTEIRIKIPKLRWPLDSEKNLLLVELFDDNEADGNTAWATDLGFDSTAPDDNYPIPCTCSSMTPPSSTFVRQDTMCYRHKVQVGFYQRLSISVYSNTLAQDTVDCYFLVKTGTAGRTMKASVKHFNPIHATEFYYISGTTSRGIGTILKKSEDLVFGIVTGAATTGSLGGIVVTSQGDKSAGAIKASTETVSFEITFPSGTMVAEPCEPYILLTLNDFGPNDYTASKYCSQSLPLDSAYCRYYFYQSDDYLVSYVYVLGKLKTSYVSSSTTLVTIQGSGLANLDHFYPAETNRVIKAAVLVYGGFQTAEVSQTLPLSTILESKKLALSSARSTNELTTQGAETGFYVDIAQDSDMDISVMGHGKIELKLTSADWGTPEGCVATFVSLNLLLTNDPLHCTVSASGGVSTLKLERELSNIPKGSTIRVHFRGINTLAAYSNSFTIKSYITGSIGRAESSSTANLFPNYLPLENPTSAVDTSNYYDSSFVQALPLFRSKVYASNSERAPIRTQFKLGDNCLINSIKITGFDLTAATAALDGASNLPVCFYKKFSTYYPYETSSPGVIKYPSSVCSISGSTLTIPTPSEGFLSGVIYQLVITTYQGFNADGSPTLSGLDNLYTNDDLASNADKFLTFNFIDSSAAGTLGAVYRGVRQVYRGLNFNEIALKMVYFTSTEKNQNSNIFFTFTLNNPTFAFPAEYMEIELPRGSNSWSDSLSIESATSGYYNKLNCYLSSTENSLNLKTECVYVARGGPLNYIRIQRLPDLCGGDFSLSIEDVILPNADVSLSLKINLISKASGKTLVKTKVIHNIITTKTGAISPVTKGAATVTSSSSYFSGSSVSWAGSSTIDVALGTKDTLVFDHKGSGNNEGLSVVSSNYQANYYSLAAASPPPNLGTILWSNSKLKRVYVRQNTVVPIGSVNLQISNLNLPRADYNPNYSGATDLRVSCYSNGELANILVFTLPILSSKNAVYTIATSAADAYTPLISNSGRALLKFTVTPEVSQSTLYDTIKLEATGITFERCWAKLDSSITSFYDCGFDTNSLILTRTGLVNSPGSIDVFAVSNIGSSANTNVRIFGFINGIEQWRSQAVVSVTITGYSAGTTVPSKYSFYEYRASGNFFQKISKVSSAGGYFPVMFPFQAKVTYMSLKLEILIKQASIFNPPTGEACIVYIYEEKNNGFGHDFKTFADCAYDSTGGSEKITIEHPKGICLLEVGTSYLLMISSFSTTINPGLNFPSSTNKIELLFDASESSAVKQKDFYNYFGNAPIFKSLTLSHLNTKASEYNTIEVKFQLNSALPIPTTSQESAIWFDFDYNFFDDDLGIPSISANTISSSYTLSNSKEFPAKVVGCSTCKIEIIYGKKTQNKSPRIVLVSTVAFAVQPQEYILTIPLIKNPIVNKPLNILISIISLASASDSYFNYRNKYELWGTGVSGNTPPGPLTASITSVTASKNSPQLTSVSIAFSVTIPTVTLQASNRDDAIVIVFDYFDLESDSTFEAATVSAGWEITQLTNTYTFILRPTADTSGTVTPTISGLTIGMSTDGSLSPKVRIVKKGVVVNEATILSTIEPRSDFTIQTFSETAAITNRNIGSFGQFKISFTALFKIRGSIHIDFGGALILANYNSNNFYRSHLCSQYKNLVSDSGKILNCYSYNTYQALVVTGFAQISAGTSIDIHFFAKINGVRASNTYNPVVTFYDDAVLGRKIAIINNANLYSNAFDISANLNSAAYKENTRIEKYYDGESASVAIKFSMRNILYDGTHAGKLTLTLPTGWTFTNAANGASHPIAYIYENEDLSIYSHITNRYLSISGQALTLDFYSAFGYSFDLTKDYILQFNTIYNTNNGVLHAFGLSTWKLESYLSTTLQEISYMERFTGYRQTTTASADFAIRELNRENIIEITFSSSIAAAIGDEIWIEFPTHDGERNIWPENLGYVFSSTEVFARILGDNLCKETSSSVISDSALSCELWKGDATNKVPAVVRIPITKVITSNTQWKIRLVKVLNPNINIANFACPLKINVMSICRVADGDMCPKSFKSVVMKMLTAAVDIPYTNGGTFASDDLVIDKTGRTHTFTLSFTNNLVANDVIVIQYPIGHNFRAIPTSCSVSTHTTHTCEAFSTINWIVITLASGTNTNSFTLAITSMNNAATQWISDNANAFKVWGIRAAGSSNDLMEAAYYVNQPTWTVLTSADNAAIVNNAFTPTRTGTYIYFLKQDPKYPPGFNNAIQSKWNKFYTNEYVVYYQLKVLSSPAQGDIVFDKDYCSGTLYSTVSASNNRDQENNTPNKRNLLCSFVPSNEIIQLVFNPSISQDSYATAQNYELSIDFRFRVTVPGSYDFELSSFGKINVAGSDQKISRAVKTITVSGKNFPFLYDHNINTLTSIDRIAQVNQNHEWLLLAQPRLPYVSTYRVNKIVLQLNEEFGYPQDTPDWDCTFYGDKRYKLSPSATSCSIERTGAKTLINIVPNLVTDDWGLAPNSAGKYDFFKLNVTHPTKRFIAPKVSTSIFQIQIFYYVGSQLVETGVANISRIQQDKLSQIGLTVNNFLNAEETNLMIVQFTTGALRVPQGYLSGLVGDRSSIILRFSTKKLSDGSRWQRSQDVGTGVQDGDQVGCSLMTGLSVAVKKRIRCYLRLGTSWEYEGLPEIEVRDYEAIPASTTVKIVIDKIKSLSVGQWNWVYVGIRNFARETYGNSYMYEFNTALSPTPGNPCVGEYGKFDFLDGVVTFTGSDQVLGLSSYTFQFTTTVDMATTDYLVIDFGSSGLFSRTNDDFSGVTVDNSGNAYVLPETQKIFVQFSCDWFAEAKTLTVNNLANFDYEKPSQSYTKEIKIYSIINNYIVDQFQFTITRDFKVRTSMPIATANMSSFVGGQNKQVLDVTFQTGHNIPVNKGGIVISFSEGRPFGNFIEMKSTCTLLDGFEVSKTVCIMNEGVVSIPLRGGAFSGNSVYKVRINGVNIPNLPSSYVSVIVSTIFDMNDDSKTMAEVPITPTPQIIVTPLIACTLAIDTLYTTAGQETPYDFKVLCQGPLRKDSIMYLRFPREYRADLITKSSLKCSSNDDILRDENCEINFLLDSEYPTLVVKIKEYNAFSAFGLNVAGLNNPLGAKGVISGFKLTIVTQEITYAEDDGKAASFISSSDYTSSETPLHALFNVPVNKGVPSSYIFSIGSVRIVNMIEVDSASFFFPDNFLLGLGQNINCGYFVTAEQPNIQLNSIVRYDNLLTTLNSNANSTVECSVTNKRVTIKKIGAILRNNANGGFINWVVNKVVNPSVINTDFRIVYESGKTVAYNYKNSLVYSLSESPSPLKLSKIVLSDYNIRRNSQYKFLFEATRPLLTSYHLGVVINFPEQYNGVMASQPNFTCTNSLSLNNASQANCKFYGRTLVIDTRNYKVNSVFDVTISSLLNPDTKTFCTSSGNSQAQFKYDINMIDLKTNDILAKVFDDTSSNNCVAFVKEVFSIFVTGPPTIGAGLSGVFNVTLEQPGEGIELTPRVEGDLSYISFEPELLRFDSYFEKTKQFKVMVNLVAPGANFAIKWSKKESTTIQYYLDILDTPFKVVQASGVSDSSKIIVAFVDVEQVNTVSPKGIPLSVNVTLSLASSTLLIVELTPKESSSTVQISDDKLTFLPGETVKQFFVVANSPGPAQVIEFSLKNETGHVPKTYALKKSQLRIEVKSEPQNYLLKTLGTETLQVSRSVAEFNILLSEKCRVHWALVYTGTPALTSDDLLNKNSTKILISGSLTTYQRTKRVIDYVANIRLERIAAMTNYTLYTLAEGIFGLEDSITNIVFKTKDLSFGAVIHITLTKPTPSDLVLNALAPSLRLKREYLSLFSDYGSTQAKDIDSKMLNPRQIVYDVLLIPNPVNDEVSAMDQAQKILEPIWQNYLKRIVPTLDEVDPIQVYEFRLNLPKIAEGPKVTRSSYYNVSISMRMWEASRIYAIRIKRDNPGVPNFPNKPLSEQIYRMMNQVNDRVDITPFYVYRGFTDVKGFAEIVFDDLKDNSVYDIYITAGSNLPYEPPFLLKDKDVQQITIATPRNENVERYPRN